jgi:hypothetical protein
VDIELHQAFVSHFQQEGLARFLICDVGPFHDLVNLERLLAERRQDIFSIIQHNRTPDVAGRASSLTIRKLVFRDHALGIVRFALDAVSQAPICLNGHPLDDCVNDWRIGFGAALRALTLVVNVIVLLVGM